MKKYIVLIALFGLMACSGEKKESDEAPQITKEEMEVLEQSTQEVDAVIDSSTQKIDTLQNEIDDLLKDI